MIRARSLVVAFTALTGTISSYSVLLLVRFCFGAGEGRRLSRLGALLWLVSRTPMAYEATGVR